MGVSGGSVGAFIRRLFPLGTIRDAALGPQGMSLILVLVAICVLFVLFRMKGVETDYRVGAVNEEIEEAAQRNKELKAGRAKLLSAGNLKRLARRHGFAEPKGSQIIVVPKE